jgi:hypothetical protein
MMRGGISISPGFAGVKHLRRLFREI